MSFDRTKKSSANNTDEDLKNEEDTSSDDDQSEENEDEQEEDTSTNEDESEEDESDGSDEEGEDDADEEEVPEGVDPVEFWKGKAKKEKRDKENYKQGLISKKAGSRVLSKDSTKETKPDVNEQVVLGVLEKQNEKTVLRNVINSKHADYIPELVDDDQYAAIVGYLPRNLDKSRPEAIVKALKLATKMWKEDNGIVDKVTKKKNDLHTSKSGTSGASTGQQKKEGRKILKQSGGMDQWYKS